MVCRTKLPKQEKVGNFKLLSYIRGSITLIPNKHNSWRQASSQNSTLIPVLFNRDAAPLEWKSSSKLYTELPPRSKNLSAINEFPKNISLDNDTAYSYTSDIQSSQPQLKTSERGESLELYKLEAQKQASIINDFPRSSLSLAISR